jgi:hypothetical protein
MATSSKLETSRSPTLHYRTKWDCQLHYVSLAPPNPWLEVKMDPVFVFASLWIDLGVAAVLGAIGGLGLGLLQENGLEMPHWYTEKTEVMFADLGFLSDVLVGALAAIIIYSLNPPTLILQLLPTAIGAGIGGSGILKGYINGTAARGNAALAEKYRMVATDASTGKDVTDRLAELREADKLVMRRWGPRAIVLHTRR